MCVYNICNNIISLLSCKKQPSKPVLRLDEENKVTHYYEVPEY